jgi:hypothetical protein
MSSPYYFFKEDILMNFESKEKGGFNAKPVMFGSINNVFDEKGSSFLAIRKVQWCKEDAEPDESKAKLEIRRWTLEDGKEKALKGCTFLTEEGPHNLVKALIEEGYGHTGEVLKELKHRDDFRDAVEHLNDEEDFGEGEFFDMRSVLLAEDGEEEDE